MDASNPQTAIDGNGNAVAVWIENGVVISKNRPVGGDWGTSTQISTTGASSPHVVVDPAGNATAIWVESGAIQVASQPFGSTWGSVTTLSSTGASSPAIAVDPSGNVVAVWAVGGAIQSATNLFGGSWPGSPDILASASSAAPEVAISSGGTVVAIWHTLNAVSSVYNVNVVTKSTPSDSWSVAATASNPAFNSVYPHVAVDSAGNIFAIWYRYNLLGAVYSDVVLQNSTLFVGNPWTTPVDISTPGEYNPANLSARVRAYQAGASALWVNSHDGSSFSIETSSTDGNQLWTSPQLLFNSLYSFSISMGINSMGDVFGLYMDYNAPSSSIFINAVETHIGGYLDGTWGNPVTISTGTSNASPQVAAVINGLNNFASAVWLGYNGSNTVVMSSFGTGSAVNPPSNIAVTQSANNLNVFTEYKNTVTWNSSSDPSLDGYGIYRNGAFLTLVPAARLQFVDDNQPQNGSVIYGVSAIDETGTESAIISVSFP